MVDEAFKFIFLKEKEMKKHVVLAIILMLAFVYGDWKQELGNQLEKEVRAEYPNRDLKVVKVYSKEYGDKVVNDFIATAKRWNEEIDKKNHPVKEDGSSWTLINPITRQYVVKHKEYGDKLLIKIFELDINKTKMVQKVLEKEGINEEEYYVISKLAGENSYFNDDFNSFVAEKLGPGSYHMTMVRPEGESSVFFNGSPAMKLNVIWQKKEVIDAEVARLEKTKEPIKVTVKKDGKGGTSIESK